MQTMLQWIRGAAHGDKLLPSTFLMITAVVVGPFLGDPSKFDHHVSLPDIAHKDLSHWH